jgi:hypothetical protein
MVADFCVTLEDATRSNRADFLSPTSQPLNQDRCNVTSRHAREGNGLVCTYRTAVARSQASKADNMTAEALKLSE